MVKRLFTGVVTLMVLSGLGFLFFAWQPALTAIEPPQAATFPAEQIAQGEQLALAGFCANCHTAPGGQDYAGGLGLDSGFGVIYTTNITPDPETGIGTWSEAAFVRAMRKGVSRNGAHLLPAFPYSHFAKITDPDLTALYAYFMTRTPVKAEKQHNTLPFPLNIRLLQAGWKLLFVDGSTQPYQPRADKSEAWNRGAYLSEGLGHCGACHTPRNALGGEKLDHAYGGAVIDHWLAPSLTSTSPSPLPWTEADLFDYLRNGASPLHGVAAGSMAEVVHMGLAKLPEADVRAIAVFFADLNGSAMIDAAPALATAMARERNDTGSEADHGAQLFRTACAYCHYNNAERPAPARPELALSSTIFASDPVNFIHVVLDGIGSKDGIPGLYMPGFAKSLSDDDIAELASYLRRTRTDRPAWPNLIEAVASNRKSLTASH